jgi:hypothetical protein
MLTLLTKEAHKKNSHPTAGFNRAGKERVQARNGLLYKRLAHAQGSLMGMELVWEQGKSR